ncbi:helix-turn-helix domain-containing protein [Oryzomonas sagensis]|uniref:Helix-turn-helix domain-containing protein n=1 Tax=Oryzomonas sagensis TaxID=2603857 RepID=A0ABQ6TL42_9BACT|nr:helix-turn-helix transcriptional regulator [Oryzomonas sagensis]KAB0669012.1 helix-turn-helix domain-containing protein [Oryzomonas sagensis]
MSAEWGRRLRVLRILAGFSQEIIAKNVGTSLSTYTQWETKGRQPRGTDLLERLTGNIGVRLEVLNGRPFSQTDIVLWIPYDQEKSDLMGQTDLLLMDVLPGLLGSGSSIIKLELGTTALYSINQRILIMPTASMVGSIQAALEKCGVIETVGSLAMPGTSKPSYNYLEKALQLDLITPDAAKILHSRLSAHLIRILPQEYDYISVAGWSLAEQFPGLEPGDVKRFAKSFADFIYNADDVGGCDYDYNETVTGLANELVTAYNSKIK